MSHNVYEHIEDCTDYNTAFAILTSVYIKPPNEISSCHVFATRRQQDGESLSKFLQELRNLNKDCNMKPVTAKQYREEHPR